jgi:membrane protein DedA with SNARE-associated domain
MKKRQRTKPATSANAKAAQPNERKLKLGQYLFMQHGGKIIFFGRFVALLRALPAILAGVNGALTASFLHFECGGRHRLAISATDLLVSADAVIE